MVRLDGAHGAPSKRCGPGVVRDRRTHGPEGSKRLLVTDLFGPRQNCIFQRFWPPVLKMRFFLLFFDPPTHRREYTYSLSTNVVTARHLAELSIHVSLISRSCPLLSCFPNARRCVFGHFRLSTDISAQVLNIASQSRVHTSEMKLWTVMNKHMRSQ